MIKKMLVCALPAVVAIMALPACFQSMAFAQEKPQKASETNSARETAGKSLPADTRVKARDLVRRIIAEEKKFGEIDSFFLRMKGKWTLTPEETANEKARSESPSKSQKNTAEQISEPLSGVNELEVELAFDRSRFRQSCHLHKTLYQLLVWDGRQAIFHIKFSKFFLDEDADEDEDEDAGAYIYESGFKRLVGARAGDFFSALNWPRVGIHSFWWNATDKQMLDRLNNHLPDDYEIVGQEKYRNRDCFVLKNKSIFEGQKIYVDRKDRRLRGLIMIDIPENDEVVDPICRRVEAYVEDYREIAPGLWFPMTHGVQDFSDGSSLSQHREMRVVEVKVNKPLPDELFTIKMKDGNEIADNRYDPPLSYKYKKDRTKGEWQTIIGGHKKK